MENPSWEPATIPTESYLQELLQVVMIFQE